ncbi:Alpha/beta knot methyltransferase [Phycomyces nitens]|nr:Alpha/beta knot methyltransferase [Phycomyces nitens]
MLLIRRVPRSAVYCRPSFGLRTYQAAAGPDEPANDFVYGYTSVLGALEAKKRQRLKKVFFQQDAVNPYTKKKDESFLQKIKDECIARSIPTEIVDKGTLNNLTGNRPHQGIVLKATQRYTEGIASLNAPESNGSYEATPVATRRNKTPIVFPAKNRKPFWIALDEVQDPQNLGSILRTAHFFGVDGILLCNKNSAPLSPTVSKVSAGAMEVMDIYSTNNLGKFLKATSDQGWHIVGAAGDLSVTDTPNQHNQTHYDICGLKRILNDPTSETGQQPMILVFGNEGNGLRTLIKALCHSFVTIPRQRSDFTSFKGEVDSLNVGVAVGVLVSNLLLKF